MTPPTRSIALIGMPGSGKSTIGVLLAKELAFGFVDTDLVIQERAGAPLQTIIDAHGSDLLRRYEEEAVLSVPSSRHVISTGGSAVYSEAGMAHLKQTTLLVYLQTSLHVLLRRVRNFEQRGIVRRAGQSMEDLLDERRRLYERHAALTVTTDQRRPKAVVAAILTAIARG